MRLSIRRRLCKTIVWLGIDGEGIGRFPHRYVQLCLSDSSGRYQDYIEDVNGLSTNDCLQFMLKSPGARRTNRATKTRIAGYFLTYDWTKILKDMPSRTIYRLLRPELRVRPNGEGGGFSPVRWRDYKLHFLSGMMRIYQGNRSVTIWDVGKYYQSRFVVALEQSGLGSPELITRMKNERGTWTESDLDRTLEYCLQECQSLAQLVELLETQHNAIGLHPRNWHGPGSTASALLDMHGIQEYLKDPPPDIRDAALCAYFGGRFEHSLIGERPDVTSYDVRSAYPDAIHRLLPCLAHAKWRRVKKLPSERKTALIRYRLTVSRQGKERIWGPLPCRLKDGSIVWPRGGSEGWVWSVEFWPAFRHWKGVKFLEAWVLERGCKCEPFAFVPELYDWRISRPENKQVVKLALNSMYGKIAQSAGGGSKYSSRIWAGIITAACRARMLELIAMHGDESRLYAIATDGAYSGEYHDIGKTGLGEWEVEREGAMTFLRPGIYWSKEKVRARGVGRAHLEKQIAAAEQAIADGSDALRMGTSTHFGNARQCVYSTPSGVIHRSKAYGEWLQLPVRLSLRPEPKRQPDWMPPLLDGVVSAPYGVKSVDAQALKIIGSLLEGRLARGV